MAIAIALVKLATNIGDLLKKKTIMDSIGPMLEDLLYNNNTGNLKSKIGILYQVLTLVNLTTNIGISFEIKTVDSKLITNTKRLYFQVK